MRNMRRARKADYSSYVGWGWKEPNCHLYLAFLGEYFERCRFIYVMRHGLDMAYSDNTSQMRNWGPALGVVVPAEEALRPKAALKFWVTASRRAISLGQEMGPDKFLLLSFDQLCASPRPETERLIDFLGLDRRELDIDYLASIPKTPASASRYREHDLGVLEPEDVDAVRELGFVVEAQQCCVYERSGGTSSTSLV